MNDRWRQIRKIFKHDDATVVRHMLINLPDEFIEELRSLMKDIIGANNEQAETNESKSL